MGGGERATQRRQGSEQTKETFTALWVWLRRGRPCATVRAAAAAAARAENNARCRRGRAFRVRRPLG